MKLENISGYETKIGNKETNFKKGLFFFFNFFNIKARK